MKEWLAQFRGVSTKYLNRYLAMFVAMQQAVRKNDMRPVDYIRTLLDGVIDFLPVRCLRSERLLAI